MDKSQEKKASSESESSKGKKSKKTLWIILGIIGGALLLSLAGCVGLGVFVFNDVKKINDYVEDVDADMDKLINTWNDLSTFQTSYNLEHGNKLIAEMDLDKMEKDLAEEKEILEKLKSNVADLEEDLSDDINDEKVKSLNSALEDLSDKLNSIIDEYEQENQDQVALLPAEKKYKEWYSNVIEIANNADVSTQSGAASVANQYEEQQALLDEVISLAEGVELKGGLSDYGDAFVVFIRAEKDASAHLISHYRTGNSSEYNKAQEIETQALEEFNNFIETWNTEYQEKMENLGEEIDSLFEEAQIKRDAISY